MILNLRSLIRKLPFLFFLIFYYPVLAQVTIGTDLPPKAGALLDLKENESLSHNATKGLILPRVALKEKNSLYPLIKTTVSPADILTYIGMTVYNATSDLPSDLCPGVYVWEADSGWVRLHESCDSTIDEVKLKEVAETTDLMLSKAADFKSALDIEAGKRASIYIYNSRSITTYLNNPEKLAARLKILGFTDVYISLSKEGMLGTGVEGKKRYEWSKHFNKALYSYGMKAHALRYSDTKMYAESSRIDAEHMLINTYNNSVEVEEQFHGIVTDLEPHIINTTTAPGIDISWDSTTGYGIGNVNDQLLERTMNILSQIKQNTHPLSLGEAIWFKYQEQVNNNLLQHGDVNEFLSICDDVNVMAYNDKKETIWRWGEFPILASSKPRSVYITIKTSLNTVGEESNTTSLQLRGWNYLLETMNFLSEQSASMISMKGISVFEYEGLEVMWEWINDKN